MLVNTNSSINYGQIIVAPEVIMKVVRETTLNVSGVASMASPTTGIFRRGQGREGVTLQTTESGLKIDIYVTLQENSNMVDAAICTAFAASTFMSRYKRIQTW